MEVTGAGTLRLVMILLYHSRAASFEPSRACVKTNDLNAAWLNKNGHQNESVPSSSVIFIEF